MNKHDIVKKLDGTKNGGRVLWICCLAATTAGGKTCDKKLCAHQPAEYAYVAWPVSAGGGTSSLPLIELELDIATPATNTGVADQMIDAVADDDDSKPDTSMADKEKELAAQYDKIKASTPFDSKWFDAYNGVAKPKDYQKRYPKDPLA